VLVTIAVVLGILGCFVLGGCVGWAVCSAGLAGLAAQLAQERAALGAERESAQQHVALVKQAAAEATDTIDVMQGLAQVETLLARWERAR
jgi:hypothetical protein